jgi:hypothetical protein
MLFTKNSDYLFFGDSEGNLALVDTRQSRVVQKYKRLWGYEEINFLLLDPRDQYLFVADNWGNLVQFGLNFGSDRRAEIGVTKKRDFGAIGEDLRVKNIYLYGDYLCFYYDLVDSASLQSLIIQFSVLWNIDNAEVWEGLTENPPSDGNYLK